MNSPSLARRPSPPQPELNALPARILERLAAEGVNSLADWRALKRRRHQIFGITSRVAAQLDALARVAR